MLNTIEKQNEFPDFLGKRSDDEIAYQTFAQEMISKVGLNNQSEKVDDLIDVLKKSKYYDMV